MRSSSASYCAGLSHLPMKRNGQLCPKPSGTVYPNARTKLKPDSHILDTLIDLAANNKIYL